MFIIFKKILYFSFLFMKKKSSTQHKDFKVIMEKDISGNVLFSDYNKWLEPPCLITAGGGNKWLWIISNTKTRNDRNAITQQMHH